MNLWSIKNPRLEMHCRYTWNNPRFFKSFGELFDQSSSMRREENDLISLTKGYANIFEALHGAKFVRGGQFLLSFNGLLGLYYLQCKKKKYYYLVYPECSSKIKFTIFKSSAFALIMIMIPYPIPYKIRNTEYAYCWEF